MERDRSDAEDLQKIEEYLSGNERAFEFLFDKYREKVYAVAFRFVRSKEDALDVCQEVFLRVHHGLRGFKTDSKFFTWLYRITVNRAIDFSRARKARRTVELDATSATGESFADTKEDENSPDPQDVLARKEVAARLLEAVAALSTKHRAVFVLHAMEGCSYKQIAEVVGCSLGTVMSRLFYARKKLQAVLSPDGEPKEGGSNKTPDGGDP